MTKRSKKEITVDDLALMVAKGFDSQDKRFDSQDKRFDAQDKAISSLRVETSEGFDRIDKRLIHIDARLDRIEKDIQEIDSLLVTHEEFDDLMARMKYVEMKLGIESGK